MSGGHTPGPWATEYRATSRGGYAQEIFDSKGELIATAAWYPIKYSVTTTTTNREANARLIAAAPDLLEALIKALPYVECAEDDPAYKAGAVAKVVKNMRAALAKARQSTPAPDCDGEGE